MTSMTSTITRRKIMSPTTRTRMDLCSLARSLRSTSSHPPNLNLSFVFTQPSLLLQEAATNCHRKTQAWDVANPYSRTSSSPRNSKSSSSSSNETSVPRYHQPARHPTVFLPQTRMVKDAPPPLAAVQMVVVDHASQPRR